MLALLIGSEIYFNNTEIRSLIENSTAFFLMLNVKQGSYEYQLIKPFGLNWEVIEPRSTDYEVDALTTRLCASLVPK